KSIYSYVKRNVCSPGQGVRPVDSGARAYISAHARLPIGRDTLMPADTSRRLEDCNCFTLRSAARHVGQLCDQFLASTGLRTTQFSILAKLKSLGPLTINAFAKEMVMDRTTLGRNIQPLE